MRARTVTSGALAAILVIAAGAPLGAQAAEPAGGVPAPVRLEPDAGVSAPVRLSDESTSTRWANAVTRAWARSAPSAGARRVARLRLVTEDGFPEVYLALASRPDRDGRTWVEVRLPQRPNGVTGWVRSSALGELHLVHTRLVVDRTALRITLYDNGARRFTARVGVGAPGTPTPAGSFWIREKFRVSGSPVYGPRAMGTAAYSSLSDWPGGGVVGLHGTNEPGLIPGRPSHGCIRLRNRDIVRLYALTPIGTPLLIR